MILKVESWPFFPPAIRTSQEEGRWWMECYLPDPLEDVLKSHVEWTIVTGDMGGGKSTLLRALRRFKLSSALILDNVLAQKKGEIKDTLNPLSQIMRSSSHALRQHFLDHPDHLEKLSRTQREFLRWLIEKFNDSRSYARWLDGLLESASVMDAVPFMDLYQTQTDIVDVHAQIEELLNLSRRVGYEQILATIDVDYPLSPNLVEQLSSLFDWLEPMQHVGLRVVAAIPYAIVEKAGLVHKARGRINVVYIEASRERTKEIVERYLRVATSERIKHIEQIADPVLLSKIAVLVSDEFDMPSPKGWLDILAIFLEYATRQGIPLSGNVYPEIRAAYYKKHCPLRLFFSEERRGVWRGQKFIPLDEGPSELFKILWRAKGDPVDHLAMGKTKEYVHTLARRLRVALEPDPSNPIYILNRRNEGYWLENFMARDGSGS